jgi:hypothetical protein
MMPTSITYDAVGIVAETVYVAVTAVLRLEEMYTHKIPSHESINGKDVHTLTAL